MTAGTTPDVASLNSKRTMRLGGPRQASSALTRVAFVVGIGLVITAAAFAMVNRAEEHRIVKMLQFRVEWRAADLAAKIKLAGEPVVATATDVATEPRVESEEFYQFTAAVAAPNRSIASIAWAQSVSGAQRMAFEAAEGFGILERNADGNLIPAGEREGYTPIILQNRFDDRAPAVGLDLSAEPTRRQALEAARDTGLPKSVRVAAGVSAAGPTYLMLWPIFNTVVLPRTIDARRVQLRGFVVGAFRVVDVLNGALIDTPEIPETINFYLSKEEGGASAEGPTQWVATYAPAERAVRAASGTTATPNSESEYSFTRSFEVNGQRWRLESLFSPAVVAAERSMGPLIVLVAGLLLTAVLAYKVASAARQMVVVESLVEQRTVELRRTNTQLAALIDASPHAIACIDSERRVLLWNAAAVRLFGYEAAEVLGHSYPLALPEESEEFDRRLKRLASGEVLRSLASHRRHRDGTVIDTSSSAAAFYDAAGHMMGIVFVIEDARERNEVQSQLRQAQKMEAIGQLTGGLAHDFNNLLGIILGNLDLLSERFQGGGEESDLTEAATQAAMRGAELVRQLLASSRRQPLAPKLTALTPVLQATAKLLRRSLGEDITLELKIADSLWPVLIDVAQLESTLLNLAVNARDAMPKGGRLTIELSNVVIDEHASELNVEAAPGGYVLIAVSDTGCGMSPEVRSHAFDPFYTTKGSQGTGLGLSMVHGFIKQSGGYSRIYSEPGHGTTIRLYLPHSTQSEINTAELRRSELMPRGHEVVLVVEDNEGIRGLAMRQLQSLGYRTMSAVDGVTALEIVKAGAPIDLLFTDVVMPGGLDGRGLADAARRLRPGLKILFTSGFTAAAASAAVHSQFGSNLLSKPYRKNDLAQRIRARLDSPA
jgi:PAS domain S-box-containing protein